MSSCEGLKTLEATCHSLSAFSWTGDKAEAVLEKRASQVFLAFDENPEATCTHACKETHPCYTHTHTHSVDLRFGPSDLTFLTFDSATSDHLPIPRWWFQSSIYCEMLKALII